MAPRPPGRSGGCGDSWVVVREKQGILWHSAASASGCGEKVSKPLGLDDLRPPLLVVGGWLLGKWGFVWGFRVALSGFVVLVGRLFGKRGGVMGFCRLCLWLWWLLSKPAGRLR